MKIFERLKIENPELLLFIEKNIKSLVEAIEISRNYGTEKQIEHLYELLKEIKFPDYKVQLNFTNIEPVHKTTFTLLDDWAYSKPVSFSLYRGHRVSVLSYRELYIEVLKYFYQKDKDKFNQLQNLTKFNGSVIPYFAKTQLSMRNATQIGKIWVETHFSANKMRFLLIDLFHYYNMDPTFLTIEVKYDHKGKFGYYVR